MASYIIPVASTQELSPRAADVIRTVIDETFPEHTVAFRAVGYGDNKVLSFGKPVDVPSGAQIIETYSIAQIMSKANAASVIAAAVRLFITDPKLPDFEPVKYTSATALALALDYEKPVAIDIETNGRLGDTHTPEEIEIISIAFYQEGGAHIVLVDAMSDESGSFPLGEFALSSLKIILPKLEKAIYHNGKFDIRVLNRVLGVELVNWFDTMLAHHVLNHGAGDHKLKTVARRLLGAPEWESDIKKYLKRGDYSSIPVSKLVEYNGWDVYWTFELFKLLEPMIMQDDNNANAFSVEMSAADFLLSVEKYGIPLDVDYIASYSLDLQHKAELRKNYMQSLLDDYSFNPGSWQQVKQALLRYGHLVSSTDDEHIQEVVKVATDRRVVEFCEALLAYRKATKADGTYASGWLKKSREGRVHPTYLVHGTTTGRLSSTNPNAQNVPRDKTVRKIVRTHG